jgi:membrane-associated protease RseP (regulator of RpoE activity)
MLPADGIVQDRTDELRAAVAQVMAIDDTTFGEDKRFAARFRGQLKTDSVKAYSWLAEKFHPLGYTPLFRNEGGRHVILAVKGVIEHRVSPAWVNVLLFGLTILSALWTGGLYAYPGPLNSVADVYRVGLSQLLNGWPFAVSLLGILLAHELGHYIAARVHNVAVTLPYFIPLPFPYSVFGTLGAFIQLKSPPTNRRALLDIAIAGPLAGFVVAVPILIYGLISSAPLRSIPPEQVGGFEGNSIFYVLIKYLVFGKLLPEPASYGNLPPLLYMLRFYLFGFPLPAGGQDVFLNQVAWAAWAGLLVTGLNLIPAGQLDGGHTLYVLIGKRARRVLPFILVALILLGFFWVGWFLWAALIFFLGRAYAEPLDQITELDPKRKVLAVAALILFVLVITPIPLS